MCTTLLILSGLAWIFLGSYLLFLSWNKVICYLSKLAEIKYWQALLIVATICFLTLPRFAYKYHFKNWGPFPPHFQNEGPSCPYGQMKPHHGGWDHPEADENIPGGKGKENRKRMMNE